MRYRSLNTQEDFSKDLAAYTDLAGEDYLPALERLGEGLNLKGYVTEIDDLLYSLELDLFNLERNRRVFSGQFSFVPTRVHEGVDFVIGVGQTIPHLSERAKKDLQSEIIGRIRHKQGLRPLRHEFRIAGALSQSDYDVIFADREGGQGGFDFLAEKNGEAFEVEGKCVPAFLGQAVLPEDAEIFFLALAKHFRGWNEENSIPVLTVQLSKTLDTNQAMISKLIEACEKAALTRGAETIEGYATVTFVHAAPKTNRDRLFEAMQIDSVASWARVFLSQGDPQVAVRLMSERPSRFVRSVLSTLSDSAKRQFSGNRPGVLWLHIDYLPPAIFDALAHAPAGPSFLDLLALAVLNSPKRNHLCQIIFSGGAHLTRTGTTARSGFRKVVYQSPCCRFGNVRLFSPDKAIEPSKAMESSKAKSLLRHLVNAAEQKKIEALTSLDRDDDAISACDTLVARFYRNRSPSDLRETAAASLVFKGALLERKGEPEKAVGALSEALLKFGPTSETPAKNALNAFVERAGLLYDLDRYDEALADCDEFLAHFDAAGVHEAPQFVAKALLVKGVSLAATGHIADAVNALEEVIERFSNAAADLVADYVLHAREILRQLRNDEGRV